ncbi:MAG TPA: hypothetical protein HA282_01225 [Nanoarchaeota archaeon]|nr:hypothetical protein [Candidatus Pacearchaeota archaeon]HIH17973.1 hypothetical protein [Nanoarchaeota archaeon]HIH33841.1 hypothetical protein [Nanoarchaeota archaeon]HIH50784.1 hypothetical protein [Nanoarchaeota archaeon]HIH65820.1 hypothetical protein [Nanoarchaeota archaeon]
MEKRIFEVKDKTERVIYLTNERWSHIRKRHPEVNDLELLKETLGKPDKITDYSFDENVRYYYKDYKNKEPPNRYLQIVVKYLNNHGFIITAQFKKHVK